VNKNIKIFINYFLGPVLFIWLAWSVYQQIQGQPDIETVLVQIRKAFGSSKILLLLSVILLMPVHWSLETYKWMMAVRKVQVINFARALKAILSGIAFSISTPNSIGEYVGRVLFMDDGNRIKAIALTVVANLSQLIITMLMGTVALFFLKDKLIQSDFLSEPMFYATLSISIFILITLTLIFFRLSLFIKIINKLPATSKFAWAVEAVEHVNATLLVRFLSISVLRFVVFSLQYFLLFRFFGVDVSVVECWLGISVMFLVMAAIPTIALFTDVGIKNELSIKLIGIFSSNSLGISLTTLSVWFINLVFPAVVGSLIILGMKNIFKTKNEKKQD